MNKTKLSRKERLMPNGIPKYIRVYDNGGKTADRYTVVYTGNYKKDKPEICFYVGMSENPFHPQGFGMHGSYTEMIDKPSYRHLGKKITFDNLPEDCKKVVMEDYHMLWQIGEL